MFIVHRFFLLARLTSTKSPGVCDSENAGKFIAGIDVTGFVRVATTGSQPRMRRENARVGKGGSGVARKRRRRRIDASTPGPREKNGLLCQ